MRSLILAALAAAALTGCTSSMRTIGAPRDQAQAPEPGAEVRRAGLIVIEAQRTINAVSEVVAPTGTSVATSMLSRPAAEPATAPARATAPVDLLTLVSNRLPAKRGPAEEDCCWLNPGKEAYHRRGCQFVNKATATFAPIEEALQQHRRACRTCGTWEVGR